MSSIRWRPKNVVIQTSHEVKKTFQVYRFGRSINPYCFCPKLPIIVNAIKNGGSPSERGPNVKDGGTPSAVGPKFYDGGKP